MESKPISWVLFDLGGVLVEIGGVVETIQASSNREAGVNPWEAWLRSPSVYRWETGGTSNEEFAAQIVEELNLDLSPAEFLADCSTWVLGTFPGIPEILASLEGRVGLACLSNTNPLHWPIIQRDLALHDALDRCFLSYQLGMAKPEPSTFLHVAAELGCQPQEILFIDDNRLNIAGALKAGMVAEQAFGGEEVRAALERWRFL